MQGLVFRGSRAVAAGLLTAGQLHGGAWRPLFRDVYADPRLPPTHQLRCAAAARWLLPRDAAIAGRSAAVLLDAWDLPDDAPVEVIVPAGTRFGPVHGMIVRTSSTLAPAEVATLAGCPCTTPARTCRDLATWLPVEEAVAVIDALAARHLVTPDGLCDLALAGAGVRGWRPLLRAARLADAGAASPQESRLRVRLVLAGLPRPVTQYVVRAGGRFVARLDLAWPDRRVGVEYDGLWHGDPGQFHQDRRRLNRLLAEQWIVLHATAPRLREDFASFAAEVRAALLSRTPPADPVKTTKDAGKSSLSRLSRVDYQG